MEQKSKNICLSCGMPLKKMKDFGTHLDGSIHTDYCFQCYQEGSFTDNDIRFRDRVAQNMELAHKIGWSRSKARQLASTVIPRLKRWKKKASLPGEQKL